MTTFDFFVYTAHVLGTTSRQGNEACQFYPLSLLRVFVLFRYLVTDGVRERSRERSGVRPKKRIRLGRDAKTTRLILHSLRLYFAPFKTDCEKRGLFCKLLQVTRTYF